MMRPTVIWSDAELLRQFASMGWEDVERDYADIYSWAYNCNEPQAIYLLECLNAYLQREADREFEDEVFHERWQERLARQGRE